MTDHIRQKQEEAAAKVRAIIDLPLPDDGMLGFAGEFDPWEVFPALYGSYSSEYDQCALAVLSELQADTVVRHDLGAEMLREMLCRADLCDYGTSPRACFPTQQFRALLPELIEKWRAYAALQWGQGWDTP